MPWLDFANHFLSNQRLHAWSWIRRTFSWEWGFSWWEIWLWVFLAFLVGNQRERTTLGRGFLSFHIYFGNNSVFVQMSSGPKTFLYISFVFFRSLIGNFLSLFCFCFLPLFNWELFFFAFSLSSIGNFPSFCFLLRARIDILTLGQGLGFCLKACSTAGHDIC